MFGIRTVNQRDFFYDALKQRQQQPLTRAMAKGSNDYDDDIIYACITFESYYFFASLIFAANCCYKVKFCVFFFF